MSRGWWSPCTRRWTPPSSCQHPTQLLVSTPHHLVSIQRMDPSPANLVFSSTWWVSSSASLASLCSADILLCRSVMSQWEYHSLYIFVQDEYKVQVFYVGLPLIALGLICLVITNSITDKENRAFVRYLELKVSLWVLNTRQTLSQQCYYFYKGGTIHGPTQEKYSVHPSRWASPRCLIVSKGKKSPYTYNQMIITIKYGTNNMYK